jgi:hypothetical protein
MTLPAYVSRDVGQLLNQIAAFWKPGARLTLLVRFDDDPGAERAAVFSSDHLPDVIEALRLRMGAADHG